jgi:hypothetical protein
MEKGKLLGLMRYWLVGTFLIIFAATTIYVGIYTSPDWWSALQGSFPVWSITALLCVAWYYIYKWYIGKRN